MAYGTTEEQKGVRYVPEPKALEGEWERFSSAIPQGARPMVALGSGLVSSYTEPLEIAMKWGLQSWGGNDKAMEGWIDNTLGDMGPNAAGVLAQLFGGNGAHMRQSVKAAEQEYEKIYKGGNMAVPSKLGMNAAKSVGEKVLGRAGRVLGPLALHGGKQKGEDVLGGAENKDVLSYVTDANPNHTAMVTDLTQ